MFENHLLYCLLHNVPTMSKIWLGIREGRRSRQMLLSFLSAIHMVILLHCYNILISVASSLGLSFGLCNKERICFAVHLRSMISKAEARQLEECWDKRQRKRLSIQFTWTRTRCGTGWVVRELERQTWTPWETFETGLDVVESLEMKGDAEKVREQEPRSWKKRIMLRKEINWEHEYSNCSALFSTCKNYEFLEGDYSNFRIRFLERLLKIGSLTSGGFHMRFVHENCKKTYISNGFPSTSGLTCNNLSRCTKTNACWPIALQCSFWAKYSVFLRSRKSGWSSTIFVAWSNTISTQGVVLLFVWLSTARLGTVLSAMKEQALCANVLTESFLFVLHFVFA